MNISQKPYILTSQFYIKLVDKKYKKLDIRSEKKEKHIAVITADMVNSTLFSREDTNAWLAELIDTLKVSRDFEWSLAPEIYRGDSFQCVLSNVDEVMRLSLLARTIMKSHSEKTDLRIAIGIGKAEEMTDRTGTSDGEAFRLSGHLADNIRKQKARIAIALPYPTAPLSAILDLLETVVGNWSPAQSQVIAALLQKSTHQKISENLGVSQSAVSQRISASKWWAVQNFLDTFPEHLSLYTNTHTTP